MDTRLSHWNLLRIPFLPYHLCYVADVYIYIYVGLVLESLFESLCQYFLHLIFTYEGTCFLLIQFTVFFLHLEELILSFLWPLPALISKTIVAKYPKTVFATLVQKSLGWEQNPWQNKTFKIKFLLNFWSNHWENLFLSGLSFTLLMSFGQPSIGLVPPTVVFLMWCLAMSIYLLWVW